MLFKLIKSHLDSILLYYRYPVERQYKGITTEAAGVVVQIVIPVMGNLRFLLL